ncbi:hypothetical protein ACHWQZ_G004307 [Mnemiopsis leidyi]
MVRADQHSKSDQAPTKTLKPRFHKHREINEIKKSKSRDDLCEHGHRIPSKRHTHHSADSPAREPHKGDIQRKDMRTPEIAAATVNLWTPVSTTSSSSLGAVAWRRRTLQERSDGNKEMNEDVKLLERVKKTTEPKKNGGSLRKIREDLQQMGVRTNSPSTASYRLNVFNDSVWEEYGKSGDVLVFDLQGGESELSKRQDVEKVFECEWYQERQPYPWRGRGRFNAEWSIKPPQEDTGRYRVGDFSGGLYCRRLYNTKLVSAHKDKYFAFKVHDRTHNPRIQELLMDLGETSETQTPERPENHVNGDPNFYSEDEGDDLPYADCDQNTAGSDKDVLTTTVKSHHDFEVDPQTCWPCVGCQDDDVPTTVRWCSIM